MNNSKFFENKECEFYPCHCLDEINCLFCYCPLYNKDCDGDYEYTKNVKDCSNCTTTHIRENFDFIIKKLEDE